MSTACPACGHPAHSQRCQIGVADGIGGSPCDCAVLTESNHENERDALPAAPVHRLVVWWWSIRVVLGLFVAAILGQLIVVLALLVQKGW
jgi:hypothetical protein